MEVFPEAPFYLYVFMERIKIYFTDKKHTLHGTVITPLFTKLR